MNVINAPSSLEDTSLCGLFKEKLFRKPFKRKQNNVVDKSTPSLQSQKITFKNFSSNSFVSVLRAFYSVSRRFNPLFSFGQRYAKLVFEGVFQLMYFLFSFVRGNPNSFVGKMTQNQQKINGLRCFRLVYPRNQKNKKPNRNLKRWRKRVEVQR